MLYIVLLIGLIGAILMFAGDMVLYYNKADYVGATTLEPIIAIMKKESRTRLYIGGILGPVAAFFYCVGYYHLVLMVEEEFQILGWICFFINCFAIICGGAYHSHFAYLGLIGRHNSKEALDEVAKYIDVQKKVAFGMQAVGFLMMAVLIVLKWTIFPRWMFLVTPGLLFLLVPLMRKLPKGLHMVICGGWTNWISVIYYVVAMVVVWAGY